MAEDMHTKPRGQGVLPWRLRLNALLGRARTCAGTEVGNRNVAASSRRVHDGGKANQAVRARGAHRLAARRSTPARSACDGLAAWWPDERNCNVLARFGSAKVTEARWWFTAAEHWRLRGLT